MRVPSIILSMSLLKMPRNFSWVLMSTYWHGRQSSRVYPHITVVMRVGQVNGKGIHRVAFPNTSFRQQSYAYYPRSIAPIEHNGTYFCITHELQCVCLVASHIILTVLGGTIFPQQICHWNNVKTHPLYKNRLICDSTIY